MCVRVGIDIFIQLLTCGVDANAPIEESRRLGRSGSHLPLVEIQTLSRQKSPTMRRTQRYRHRHPSLAALGDGHGGHPTAAVPDVTGVPNFIQVRRVPTDAPCKIRCGRGMDRHILPSNHDELFLNLLLAGETHSVHVLVVLQKPLQLVPNGLAPTCDPLQPRFNLSDTFQIVWRDGLHERIHRRHGHLFDVSHLDRDGADHLFERRLEHHQLKRQRLDILSRVAHRGCFIVPLVPSPGRTLGARVPAISRRMHRLSQQLLLKVRFLIEPFLYGFVQRVHKVPRQIALLHALPWDEHLVVHDDQPHVLERSYDGVLSHQNDGVADCQAVIQQPHVPDRYRKTYPADEGPLINVHE
mmetsp:Transcript_9357/g.25296  ORF Transcript_9357/g.25296 Transcript_9357/m.25296 type:complete len:355 (-) Transcript_9357:405-1469(-)